MAKQYRLKPVQVTRPFLDLDDPVQRAAANRDHVLFTVNGTLHSMPTGAWWALFEEVEVTEPSNPVVERTTFVTAPLPPTEG